MARAAPGTDLLSTMPMNVLLELLHTCLITTLRALLHMCQVVW
jgi:hypothetical protein